MKKGVLGIFGLFLLVNVGFASAVNLNSVIHSQNNANCTYSFDNSNFLNFFETGGTLHSQSYILNENAKEDANLNIFCNDKSNYNFSYSLKVFNCDGGINDINFSFDEKNEDINEFYLSFYTDKSTTCKYDVNDQNFAYFFETGSNFHRQDFILNYNNPLGDYFFGISCFGSLNVSFEFNLSLNRFESDSDISEINDRVRGEIDKLFGDNSSKLGFVPANRIISLTPGSRNKGFAFSVKNIQEEDSQFNSTVYPDPSYDLTANCGITIKQAENWIVNPSDTLNLLRDSSMDVPVLVLFSIPETAPECNIPYVLEIKQGEDTYAKANVYVQISSSSDLDCSLIEFDRSIVGKSQCVSNCECLENLDAPGIFVEFYRVEKDKYCMVQYSGIDQKECDSNCECVTAGYEQVSWDEMATYNLIDSNPDEDESEEQIPSTCQLGYRQNGTYCNLEGIYVSQKVAESACDNNFECESNLCIDSSCVSSSIWTKFMSWLKNLFG